MASQVKAVLHLCVFTLADSVSVAIWKIEVIVCVVFSFCASESLETDTKASKAV